MNLDAPVIPDLYHHEEAALRGLWRTLHDLQPRNEMLSAYFDGEASLRHIGVVLPQHMSRTAAVLGWPEKAVTSLNRRCVLDGFHADVDLDSLGLAELLRDNAFDVEFPQATMSSLLHGPAFLITTFGGDDEPDVLITAKDALSGAGTWDRRRRRLRDFLSVNGLDEETGQPDDLALYLPDLTITLQQDEKRDWVVKRRPHAYGLPVDPLVHQPRLDKPLGTSRITRAIRASNDRALRAVLRTEVTAEFYSVPQRILLGADESAFQGPDGTTRSTWQARLLSVWAIPDDDEAETPRAEVKEFSAAPQDPHLAQLRAEAQVFSGLSDIPVGELGLTNDTNPTSAESYEASRQPLVSMAERTTDTWTPSVRSTIVRALAMGNQWAPDEVPDEIRALRPSWRSPKYESRAAVADAGAKQLASVPWLAETEVGLELLGLTPDQAERALAERRRAQGMGRIVDILSRSQAAADGNLAG